jgi:2-polyprenyl-3-methyl-5-hydroxy-6-metoxy-1,4-benzoquinol methylase
MPSASKPPSPILFFETVNAYQRTATLKGAIELEVFTAIGEGAATAAEIAKRSKATERGARTLCDYLVVMGFLTKKAGRYALTADSAVFLDKRSPAYMGGALRFLLAPAVLEHYQDIAGVVRKGGTLEEQGALEPENPIWVEFARGMAPLMLPAAQAIAGILREQLIGEKEKRVLDIAAGHGAFGVTLAKQYPNVHVTALDWANVLAVAEENAHAAGVSARYSTLPGSAFEADLGSGYSAVLLTNILHHFDPPTCEKLLRRVHASLSPGALAVLLEFVPNQDRVSPPVAACFSMVMLASTPHGDAYTYKELQGMLQNSGFREVKQHSLVPLPEDVITARRG